MNTTSSWSAPTVQIERRDDASVAVRLEGVFRPAWMAGLCAGLAERGVSIQRVEATSTDGRWRADLSLVPPAGVDPHAIPYGALVDFAPDVQAGPFQTKRYRLTESAEHGGTLKLELHAQDSIGFLGRVLSQLAMLSLFPVSMHIETRSRLAHDRFWLSGVGRALPTRQTREVLERMLASTAREELGRQSIVPDRFVPPPWGATLDGTAAVRAIDPEISIAGMFPEAIVQEARRHSITLSAARERYVPFEFYPLIEHAKLMLQAAQRLYPERPLRGALRIFGRTTPDVLLSSTIGRVMLGTAQDVHSALASVARTYAMNIRPSRAEVIEKHERSAVLRLHQVGFFLDSLHVGVLEGTMSYAGVRGTVYVAAERDGQADFLCTW